MESLTYLSLKKIRKLEFQPDPRTNVSSGHLIFSVPKIQRVSPLNLPQQIHTAFPQNETSEIYPECNIERKCVPKLQISFFTKSATKRRKLSRKEEQTRKTDGMNGKEKKESTKIQVRTSQNEESIEGPVSVEISDIKQVKSPNRYDLYNLDKPESQADDESEEINEKSVTTPSSHKHNEQQSEHARSNLEKECSKAVGGGEEPKERKQKSHEEANKEDNSKIVVCNENGEENENIDDVNSGNIDHDNSNDDNEQNSNDDEDDHNDRTISDNGSSLGNVNDFSDSEETIPVVPGDEMDSDDDKTDDDKTDDDSGDVQKFERKILYDEHGNEVILYFDAEGEEYKAEFVESHGDSPGSVQSTPPTGGIKNEATTPTSSKVIDPESVRMSVREKAAQIIKELDDKRRYETPEKSKPLSESSRSPFAFTPSSLSMEMNSPQRSSVVSATSGSPITSMPFILSSPLPSPFNEDKRRNPKLSRLSTLSPLYEFHNYLDKRIQNLEARTKINTFRTK